jgi:hypothetical protein
MPFVHRGRRTIRRRAVPHWSGRMMTTRPQFRQRPRVVPPAASRRSMISAHQHRGQQPGGG